MIKKHRYSGFMGTDLDMMLRTQNIDTVAVTGVTTENCCHATARDAMFNGYKVAFISDATGTFDYPISASASFRPRKCIGCLWGYSESPRLMS